jgi:hypothetical protein
MVAHHRLAGFASKTPSQSSAGQGLFDLEVKKCPAQSLEAVRMIVATTSQRRHLLVSSECTTRRRTASHDPIVVLLTGLAFPVGGQQPGCAILALFAMQLSLLVYIPLDDLPDADLMLNTSSWDV